MRSSLCTTVPRCHSGTPLLSDRTRASAGHSVLPFDAAVGPALPFNACSERRAVPRHAAIVPSRAPELACNCDPHSLAAPLLRCDCASLACAALHSFPQPSVMLSRRCLLPLLALLAAALSSPCTLFAQAQDSSSSTGADGSSAGSSGAAATSSSSGAARQSTTQAHANDERSAEDCQRGCSRRTSARSAIAACWSEWQRTSRPLKLAGCARSVPFQRRADLCRYCRCSVFLDSSSTALVRSPAFTCADTSIDPSYDTYTCGCSTTVTKNVTIDPVTGAWELQTTPGTPVYYDNTPWDANWADPTVSCTLVHAGAQTLIGIRSARLSTLLCSNCISGVALYSLFVAFYSCFDSPGKARMQRTCWMHVTPRLAPLTLHRAAIRSATALIAAATASSICEATCSRRRSTRADSSARARWCRARSSRRATTLLLCASCTAAATSCTRCASIPSWISSPF